MVFTKIKDNNKVKDAFTYILRDIDNWSNASCATLSIEKCDLLHICNKKNCHLFDVEYKNIKIKRVNNLRILSIIFDKSFNFKEHCLQLRKSLNSRLNIIKFLTSKICNINISTMVNITRSMLLSKIDYGLPICGWCAPSHIKLIKAPYHAAVRRSIGAFPTSPIINILTEAGLHSIEDRTICLTYKLIPKLLINRNKVLYGEVLKVFKYKRRNRIESITARCCK